MQGYAASSSSTARAPSDPAGFQDEPALTFLAGGDGVVSSKGIAKIGGNIHLTYAALNRAAWWLASRLRLKPGERLAVLAPDSWLSPLAVRTGQLAGFSVVPLSPLEPVPRLEQMVHTAKPAAALLPASLEEAKRCCLAAALGRGSEGLLSVEDVERELQDELRSSSNSGMTPVDSAGAALALPPEAESHVYFTSGSTGEPKACVASRGNLSSYMRGKNNAHKISTSSTCFVASAHTFDPWLTDLAACWEVGAHAVLATRSRTFADLAGCLVESRATHVLTTPALFGTIAGVQPTDIPCLDVVALGGEAMGTGIAEAWAPRVTLLNTYGVTECCAYQAIAQVQKLEEQACLGDALGENILLLAAAPGDDPRQVVSKASGEIGELWIGGPQVGAGYIGGSAEANDAFRDIGGIGRCYRSGDLVRAEKGGHCRLLGRRDAQLKINGNRIEPGEIEAVLQKIGTGWLQQVAVVKARDGAEADMLVAWCETLDLVGEEEHLGAAVLRHFCAQRLPRHMLPRQYAFLKELPKTGSGKVDRRVLSTRRVDDVNGAGHVSGAARELTTTEALVAAAWEATLRLPVDSEADFNLLSGDSLAALRVAREVHLRLKETAHAAKIPLDLGDLGQNAEALAPAALLAHPRLTDYAAHLERAFGLEATGTTAPTSTTPAVVAARDESTLLFQRCCSVESDTLLQTMLAEKGLDRFGRDQLDAGLRQACGHAASKPAMLLLQRKASPIAGDSQGLVPLHLAAQSSCLPLVQLLLEEYKVNIKVADSEGQAALHHAARRGAGRKVMDLLLVYLEKAAGGKTKKPAAASATVSVDVADIWGRTPLHWAADNGHRVAVEVLMAAGAKRTATDKTGETPLQIAERRAQCRAQDRPTGMGASVFGDIATLLGGNAKTQRPSAKA
eukprot:TRINITY_DN110779_c0_g1_i1.p1 TRINITY_DN110779_c0_g1~~TRINITY_DN110779_c0_g1_i1.p1  ORF type:complete len:905 (-),score=157.26 TRINITY_DN110779_c0_g1_i1:15-2729(-)